MKLSIVLSTQPAQFQAATFKGDLETNLEQIASLGYNGVELAIRDPRLVEAAHLESLLRKTGLSVPAIGTGQAWGEEGLSFTDPDPTIRRLAIERIQSHIPLASQLGAVIIIGLIRGTLQRGVTASQAMNWLVDALQACCEAAASAGVRYALEPINRYETQLINHTAEGLALLERVGAPNLGLLLDTFHMNIEEPHIEDSMRNCGAHIFHFHVADSNRWYPGAGHLDFSSIYRTLTAQAYPGWISGEFLPQPDALTAAARCFAHLQPLLTA